jgi:hypothetical protein
MTGLLLDFDALGRRAGGTKAVLNAGSGIGSDSAFGRGWAAATPNSILLVNVCVLERDLCRERVVRSNVLSHAQGCV